MKITSNFPFHFEVLFKFRPQFGTLNVNRQSRMAAFNRHVLELRFPPEIASTCIIINNRKCIFHSECAYCVIFVMGENGPRMFLSRAALENCQQLNRRNFLAKERMFLCSVGRKLFLENLRVITGLIFLLIAPIAFFWGILCGNCTFCATNFWTKCRARFSSEST